MRLQNKVSIVTGGASGMGAAESALFASEGSNVVVADMKIEDGMEVVDEIKSTGGNAIFMELDVTDEERWEVVVADVLKQFGTIDILVNNAGVYEPAQNDLPLERWQRAWARTLQINLVAPAELCRAADHHFSTHGEGIIINVSSRSAFRGELPEYANYAASKGGLVSLTRT